MNSGGHIEIHSANQITLLLEITLSILVAIPVLVLRVSRILGAPGTVRASHLKGEVIDRVDAFRKTELVGCVVALDHLVVGEGNTTLPNALILVPVFLCIKIKRKHLPVNSAVSLNDVLVVRVAHVERHRALGDLR